MQNSPTENCEEPLPILEKPFGVTIANPRRIEANTMNSRTKGLCTASIVFGLMALAQLARLVLRLDVLVGGHHLPLWPSAIAVVFLGSLSLWQWKLARMPGK